MQRILRHPEIWTVPWFYHVALVMLASSLLISVIVAFKMKRLKFEIEQLPIKSICRKFKRNKLPEEEEGQEKLRNISNNLLSCQ